jgi:hypothetical protein
MMLSRNTVWITIAMAVAYFFWNGCFDWAQMAAAAPPQSVASQSSMDKGAGTIPDTATLESKEQPAPEDGKPVDHIPQREDMLYEDWRKPELTPGMQSDVELIDRQEEKTFTRELLHAQWRELDPIDLWVIRPTNVKNPPVIVYLYSYPSTNQRYKDPKFCEFLTRNGFAAVGFVPALTEQRFHDRPTAEWFVSQLPESLGTSVHDVQMVLNYLDTRNDLGMNHVGMWGDGVGASIAIVAATVDKRIKVLDLLDPWGDWPNWLAKSTLVPEKEREAYLKPDFLKAVDNLDPIKYLPQLKTQPVRIQHIDGVTVTPAIVREHLETVAPANATIVHFASSENFYKEVGSKGSAFDWLHRQLGPNVPLRAGSEGITLDSGNSSAK